MYDRYRFEFFKEQFYVESAYAFKYWYVDTPPPNLVSQKLKKMPRNIYLNPV